MTSPQKTRVIRGMWVTAIIWLAAVFLDLSGLVDIYERKSIDLRTKLVRKEKPLPSDIVVILIDEASLHALDPIVGRWPWPRDVHAGLIDFLGQCEARAVVMDILFTERDIGRSAGPDQAGQPDVRLVESTAAAGNVYHASQVVIDAPDEYNPGVLNTPMPEAFVNRFSIRRFSTPLKTGPDTGSPYNQYYLPFSRLYKASRGVGAVTLAPDKDGVFRSQEPVFAYREHFFSSLSLAPILGQSGPFDIRYKLSALELKGRDQEITIPLTEDGHYYVNMYGTYASFSYSGVLSTIFKLQENGTPTELPVDPGVFRGKTVFVGASAVGVEDLKHTSIGTQTPGVLLHASMYGNIITGDFLEFVPFYTNKLILLVLVVLTVASIFLLNAVAWQAMIPILGLGIFYGISIVLFKANIVVGLMVPSLGVLAAYITCFTYSSATEGREKRKIKNILGQYVSPAMLADVLDAHKEDYLKAEVGSKEVLTIFFSDIRGFTSISEKYEVEKVVELLNGYLSQMVAIIFEQKGTLDKFIGDAIVAFWGAPVKIADHAERAVMSAIKMKDALETLNRENAGLGLPELHIGIGIHTGEVILGNIGSEKKLDYTVIGDGVNLASRLEGLTKMYNSYMIITQDTYVLIKDRIHCRMIDYVRVKGKERSIVIYEALCGIGDADPETLRVSELTQEGFHAYQERKFNESISIFEQILSVRPNDFLTKMYISRCNNYLKEPPPDDWDGYYVHKNK